MQPVAISAFNDKDIGVGHDIGVAYNWHIVAAEITGEADRYLPASIINIQHRDSRTEYMPGIAEYNLDVFGYIKGVII